MFKSDVCSKATFKRLRLAKSLGSSDFFPTILQKTSKLEDLAKKKILKGSSKKPGHEETVDDALNKDLLSNGYFFILNGL